MWKIAGRREGFEVLQGTVEANHSWLGHFIREKNDILIMQISCMNLITCTLRK